MLKRTFSAYCASLAFVAAMFITACGGGDANAPAPTLDPAIADRTYVLDDLTTIGWKSKGAFGRDFPSAVSATWGYVTGREIGVVEYPSPELARSEGAQAAASQTATVEGGRQGPEVERTRCIGFPPRGAPVRLDVPDDFGAPRFETRGVRMSTRDLPSLRDGAGGGGDVAPQLCPVRVPMYGSYAVEGNLLLMCEPRASDRPDECALIAAKLRRK